MPVVFVANCNADWAIDSFAHILGVGDCTHHPLGNLQIVADIAGTMVVVVVVVVGNEPAVVYRRFSVAPFVVPDNQCLAYTLAGSAVMEMVDRLLY